MAIRANQLNNDPRNARALYHEYGAPRGAILASDGSVMAKSDPFNDAFKYQRSYSAGRLYAPVTGFFSISQTGGAASKRPAARCCRASPITDLAAVQVAVHRAGEQGATIETSIDPKTAAGRLQQLGTHDGAAVAIEPKTGRILAMVSTPSYDPNQLASHDTKAANSNYGELSRDAKIRCSTEPPRSCILRGPRSKRWWPRRAGNRRIPAGYADSGRSKLHASGHRHTADERRTAGRRR